ncbi:hypothetical protein ABIF44_007659 [Bradyrhizobium japonicum]|uniref:hypothetical protein n=1 Tax=Bradyrhizobium japonicum TaxID=375 RepID=UPI00339355B4
MFALVHDILAADAGRQGKCSERRREQQGLHQVSSSGKRSRRDAGLRGIYFSGRALHREGISSF